MKIFRNKENKFLYYIATLGRGKTISRPTNWNHYHAFPYRTNPNAPIIHIGLEPDTKDFFHEFDDNST